VAAVEAFGLRDLLVVADGGVVALALLAGVATARVLGGDLLAAEQPVLLDRDGETAPDSPSDLRSVTRRFVAVGPVCLDVAVAHQ
jgi:hypothetical protein